MLDIIEYHQSTSKELDIIKDRVRNLIGANWGPDGQYKESVLMNTLRRFIPKNFAVGTGFVVKRLDINTPPTPSSQIDLIIYDTSFPVLFSAGDFVILTPESVRGIIEVKTNIGNLSNNKLLEMIKKVNDDSKLISEGQLRKKYLFNGIFGYEGYENNSGKILSQIDAILDEIKKEVYVPNSEFYLLNHICFNNKGFLRYWRNKKSYSLYNLPHLSFSFFISNLIYYLKGQFIEHEKDLWFPIDKEGWKTHGYSIERTDEKINVDKSMIKPFL